MKRFLKFIAELIVGILGAIVIFTVLWLFIMFGVYLLAIALITVMVGLGGFLLWGLGVLILETLKRNKK